VSSLIESLKQFSNYLFADVTPSINPMLSSHDEEASSALCLQISSVCSLAADMAFPNKDQNNPSTSENVHRDSSDKTNLNAASPVVSDSEETTKPETMPDLDDVNSNSPVILVSEKSDKDTDDCIVLEPSSSSKDDSDDCMVIKETLSSEKVVAKSVAALNSNIPMRQAVVNGNIDVKELDRISIQTSAITSSLSVKLPRSERQKISEVLNETNEIKSQVKLRILEQGDFLESCQEAAGVSCKVAFKSAELSGQVSMYFCNFCNFSSANRNMFISHVVKHLFLCKKCGFQSVTRLGLLKHIRTHADDSTRSDFNIIALSQPETLAEKSDRLDTKNVFGAPPTADEVILEFGKGKRYFCALCEFRTNNKTAIERHVLVHIGCWICPTCFFKFEQFTSAIRHLKTCHNGEETKLLNRVIKGSVEDDAQSNAPRVVVHRLMTVTVVNDPIDITEYHFDICSSYLYLLVFEEFHLPIVRYSDSQADVDNIRDIKKLQQLFVARSRYAGGENSKTWLCNVTGCYFASQFAPQAVLHSILCHPKEPPHVRHSSDPSDIFTVLRCKKIKSKYDNLMDMMVEASRNSAPLPCMTVCAKINRDKANLKPLECDNTPSTSTSGRSSQGTIKKIATLINDRIGTTASTAKSQTLNSPNLTNLLAGKLTNKAIAPATTASSTFSMTTTSQNLANQVTAVIQPSLMTTTSRNYVAQPRISEMPINTISSIDCSSGKKKNIILPANVTLAPNTVIKTPEGYFLVQPSPTVSAPIITMPKLTTTSITSTANVAKTTVPVMSTGLQKTQQNLPNIQRASSPSLTPRLNSVTSVTTTTAALSSVITTVPTSTVTSTASAVLPSNLPSGSKSFFKLTPGTNISLNSGKNKFTLINKGGQLFLQPTDGNASGSLLPVSSGPNGKLQLVPPGPPVSNSTPIPSAPLTARMNAPTVPSIPTSVSQTISMLSSIAPAATATTISNTNTMAGRITDKDKSQKIYTVNKSGQIEMRTVTVDAIDQDKSLPVDPSKIKKEKSDEKDSVSKSAISTSSALTNNTINLSTSTGGTALSQSILRQINQTNAPRIVLGTCGTSGSVVSSIRPAIVSSMGQPTLIISGRNQTPTMGAATSLLRQIQTSQPVRIVPAGTQLPTSGNPPIVVMQTLTGSTTPRASSPGITVAPRMTKVVYHTIDENGKRVVRAQLLPPTCVASTVTTTSATCTVRLPSSGTVEDTSGGSAEPGHVYVSIEHYSKVVYQGSLAKFSCNFCAYTSFDRKDLQTHLYKHNGRRWYRCPFCPHESTARKVIFSHTLASHPGKRVGQCISVSFQGDEISNCPFCDYTGNSMEDIVEHISSEHPDPSTDIDAALMQDTQDDEESSTPHGFQCNHCDFSNADLYCLKCHILVEHQGRELIAMNLMQGADMDNQDLIFMCSNRSCLFSTNVYDDLVAHSEHCIPPELEAQEEEQEEEEVVADKNQDIPSPIATDNSDSESASPVQKSCTRAPSVTNSSDTESASSPVTKSRTRGRSATNSSDTESASSPVKKSRTRGRSATNSSDTESASSPVKKSRTRGPSATNSSDTESTSSTVKKSRTRGPSATNNLDVEFAFPVKKSRTWGPKCKRRKVVRVISSDEESEKNDEQNDDEDFVITINKSGDESNSQSGLDISLLEKANESVEVPPENDVENHDPAAKSDTDESDVETVHESVHESEKDGDNDEQVKDRSVDGAGSDRDETMDADVPSGDNNESDTDSVTLNVASTINQLKYLGASIEGSSVSDMFGTSSFADPFKSPEIGEVQNQILPEESEGTKKDNEKDSQGENNVSSASEKEDEDAKSSTSVADREEREMPSLQDSNIADKKSESWSRSPSSSRSSPMPDLYIEPDVPGPKADDTEKCDLDTWLDNIGRSSSDQDEQQPEVESDHDLRSDSDGSHMENVDDREMRLFECDDLEDLGDRKSEGEADSYHGDEESIAEGDEEKCDESEEGGVKGEKEKPEKIVKESRASGGEENISEETQNGDKNTHQASDVEKEEKSEKSDAEIPDIEPGVIMSPEQDDDIQSVSESIASVPEQEAVTEADPDNVSDNMANDVSSIKPASPHKGPRKRRSAGKRSTVKTLSEFSGVPWMPSGYKCMYCDETNDHVLPLKIHIMHFHPMENLVSIDLKAQYNRQRKYVQFCMVRECDFHCMIMKDLVAHYKKFPDHVVQEDFVNWLVTKAKTERVPKKRREIPASASGVTDPTPLSPSGSFDPPDTSEVGSDFTYDDDAASSASAFSESVFSELVGPIKVRKRKQVNYNEGHLAGIMEEFEPKKRKKISKKVQKMKECEPCLVTSQPTAEMDSIELTPVTAEKSEEVATVAAKVSPKKIEKPLSVTKPISATKQVSAKKDPVAKKAAGKDPVAKKAAKKDPVAKKAAKKDPVAKKEGQVSKKGSPVASEKADKVSNDFKWNLKCGHCLFHDKSVPNMKNHLVEKHADESRTFATDVYARHQRKKSQIYICLKPNCDYKTYKYDNMSLHKELNCGKLPHPEQANVSEAISPSYSEMSIPVSESASDYSTYSSAQPGKSTSPQKCSPRSKASKEAQNALLNMPDVHKCQYCEDFSVDRVNDAVIPQIQLHHKQRHPDEPCLLISEKNRFLHKPSQTFFCVEDGCTFFSVTAARLFAHQAGHEDPTMQEFRPKSDVLATYDDVMDL
jgi:hypothetical protein